MGKTISDPAALSQRTPEAELQRLAGLFARLPLLGTLLDAVPEFYMILNRTRQIVFANQVLREHAKRTGGGAMGLRPGEAMGCAHSCENPGGCGLSESCLDCGALLAILGGQRGTPAVEECRLTLAQSEVLDLRVFATPLAYEGESFVILAATDISSEKRREALEHTFFHDIGNTVAIIYGSADVLLEMEPQSKMALNILSAAQKLLGEFEAQRDLLSAERGKLVAHTEPLHTGALLKEVAASYAEQKWTADRRVLIAEDSCDMLMVSDRTLLGRVLGNIVKNALEACKPKEAVTLRCVGTGGFVEFQVHDPQAMPLEVQRQIFQRSFSTKGPGRGLGTYSIKLLSESYLEGQVSFESSLEKGTTFTARFPQTLLV